jgi:SHS family lactate transporter-like MFS transporter
MPLTNPFRSLSRPQFHAFLASLAGWALDAFDFFLLVFAVHAIAQDFHTDVHAVSQCIFWTLAMRPVGALLFGWLAERYGRRPILMINVVSYSVCELASAAAPDLRTLIVTRALFGLAMGGEWGIGAALTLETLPTKNRGFFSGLLQEGYVIGYLLASLVFKFLFDRIGWRGMFVLGASPALLVLYVRRSVEESPAWLARAREGGQARQPRPATREGSSVRATVAVLGKHWHRLLFLVLLMSCFNALSHGSQDLYPTFLQVQRGFSPSQTGTVAIVYNVGALCGGMFFGALSERTGRRRAIATAAMLALPVLPLWAYSATLPMLALGGFLIQFMIQGAWGVVPAHLNELSPPSVRAILPGFAYQLGNLAMSQMAPVQSLLAERGGNDYAGVLVWTVGSAAVVLAVCAMLGREAKDTAF